MRYPKTISPEARELLRQIDRRIRQSTKLSLAALGYEGDRLKAMRRELRKKRPPSK